MSMKRLVLGGGCFWCIEAIFSQVRGVNSAVSGYSGGDMANPSYQLVCSGMSGHAEIVDISYDDTIVSLDALLEIFFAIHDPTTLNRQGADVGTQYRSVIYYEDEAHKQKIIDAMQKAQQNYSHPIVTELSPLGEVYAAEEYHQNYYMLNPNQGYCQVVIAPKVQKFFNGYSQYLK